MRLTKTGILLLYLLLLTFSAGAQKADRKPYGYTVMFYNAENLFDTIDNPHCNDNDYLPGSKNAWDRKKYLVKLTNLSKVIAAVDSVSLPVLVGLAEIENRVVLEELVAQPLLAAGKYKIIHEESSDPRCIDVALLYRPDLFTEISHIKIPVFYEDSAGQTARECLYVLGVLRKTDTIHLIVNHWKSRTGGTEQTESKRIIYAQTIRHWVDSLMAKRPSAKILLMGDFNDTPTDMSIRNYLVAGKKGEVPEPTGLLNLTCSLAEAGIGSHYFKSWELFDQVMISQTLRKGKKKRCYVPGMAIIFSKDWMMFKNNKGEMVPSRTYASGKYYGGYSDHLPVAVKIVF